jgi:hypothetical protein
MDVRICLTCGAEYPGDAVPEVCVICADDRQYLPVDGQLWTSHEQLRGRHTFSVTEEEPDLYRIRVTPEVAIGQVTTLVRTEAGNLLWEPSGYLDDAMVAAVTELGGVAAIGGSHPHLMGAAVSWSHAYGGVPVWWNGDDRRWVTRPDPALRFWQDRQDVLPGVTLIQAAGHFAGSCVAHWAPGAEGRGVLLTGDTIAVAADRSTVTFLRSYPNRIPLSERSVRKIVTAVAGAAYDRIYSGFDAMIPTGAARAVTFSAERYIGWIRDEIRDPDERV